MRARAGTLAVAALALVLGGAVGVLLALYVPWPFQASHGRLRNAAPSRSAVQSPYYPKRLRATDLDPRPAVPRRLRLSKAQAMRFSPWRDPSDDPDLAHAPGALPVAHHRIWLGRRVSSLMTYRGLRRELCVIEHLPPEGGVFHCIERRVLSRAGAVYFEVASAQVLRDRHPGWDLVWVWGIRSARFSGLQAILSDCTKMPVPVDRDGVFFFVFGPKLLWKSIRPEMLLARGRDGTILFRRQIHVAPTDDTKTRPRSCRSRAGRAS